MPRRRRYDQPRLESLPLLARFLNHACAMEDVSQATIAKRLGVCTATISRWFRGMGMPMTEDFQEIAKLLSIPVETLFAVRILQDMSGEPMLASVGAWRYMIINSPTIVFAGLSMGAGIVPLRDAELNPSTVLCSILEPSTLSKIECQPNVDVCETGSLRSSWVMTTNTLIAKIMADKARGRQAQGRLWVRTKETLDPEEEIAQLAANRWLAIVSGPPYKKPKFSVHFYGDPLWKSLVEPLIDGLSSDTADGELIWDSEWSPSDPRMAKLKRRFSEAKKSLSIDWIKNHPFYASDK